MGLLIRAAEPADAPRLREVAFAAKARWGYERELGARSLEWDADPNAAGFYEKLGARRLGERPGEWGRPLPWLGLEL